MKLRTLVSAMALAGFSASALAVAPPDPIPAPHGPAPNLQVAEYKLYAIAEALLSKVAGFVTSEGCDWETYPLHIRANDDLVEPALYDYSEGNVDREYVRIPVIDTDGSPGIKIDARGIRIAVTEDLGNPDNIGEIGNASVTGYQTRAGGFGFDNEGAMMYASADFVVEGVAWDEHIIKDFWVPQDSEPLPSIICPAQTEPRVVFDEGLELITKQDFPRSKWHQSSVYVEPNGCNGFLDIWKFQIAPDTQNLCAIHLYADLDDLNDGLETARSPFGQAWIAVRPVGAVGP